MAMMMIVRAAVGTACGMSLVACLLGSAVANDSTASLDTGGLRLTFNPDIQMKSEDLYISRDEVRVTYRFLNKTNRDIHTLVAFPLPAMDIGEEGNYALEGRDPVNLVDFQVTVDGRRVEPSVEIKATRFGVDVTSVLQRYGIPITMLARDGGAAEALNKRLDRLPDEAKRELERHGVIDWNTTFGARNEPLANVHWNAHITYFWFQSFPANREVEVAHRYKPVPRLFFFTKDDLASAEMRKTYCMDPSFIRAAQTKFQQAGQNYVPGYEMRYVLTTAGNWMGTIQKFRLTIEKPSPDALLSLCAPGIKRVSPTSFVLSLDEYGPQEDLRILFIVSKQKD